jgi:Uma2 family endonuclease
MRALMLEAPEDLLERRRRLGHDKRDELWEGVLHMVPPPAEWHQRFGSRILVALSPIAAKLGLEGSYETGVFKDDKDYRVPDLVIAAPSCRSKRGVERGAAVAIEILSPDDESRQKLEFYAAVEVSEVWLLDPDSRAFEIYVLRGAAYHAALPDDRGAVRSPALGVTLSVGDGPQLALAWPDGSTRI